MNITEAIHRKYKQHCGDNCVSSIGNVGGPSRKQLQLPRWRSRVRIFADFPPRGRHNLSLIWELQSCRIPTQQDCIFIPTMGRGFNARSRQPEKVTVLTRMSLCIQQTCYYLKLVSDEI
jgi:hypothetical protein